MTIHPVGPFIQWMDGWMDDNHPVGPLIQLMSGLMNEWMDITPFIHPSHPIYSVDGWMINILPVTQFIQWMNHSKTYTQVIWDIDHGWMDDNHPSSHPIYLVDGWMDGTQSNQRAPYLSIHPTDSNRNCPHQRGICKTTLLTGSCRLDPNI